MAEDTTHTVEPRDGDQQSVPPEAQFVGAYTDQSFGSGLRELAKPRPDVTLDQIIELRTKFGHGRALSQLILLPLRFALQKGTWVAPDVVEGDSDKEVDFANLMWSLPKSAGGMSQPASKIIRQMLLSIPDGFAPFEQVVKRAETGPLKGKWVLKKLSYCDPRTVTVLTDDLGSYEGIRQRTHTLNGTVRDVRVPKDYSLVFTYGDEENPYYGKSMFEAAYPHYEIIKKLYYIAHMAAQFAAVPGRVGKVPRRATAQQVQEFKAALANFAFNTSMVTYQDFEVNPFSSNSGFDFLALINHHRLMMTKSVLAGFFDNEDRTVLIENANQDASADMFLLTLETIAEDIAHVLSDYMMPKFIDWNFGTGIYPRFQPAKLTDSAKSSIQETFRNFAMSGILNCTPEMVREMEKKVAADFDLDIDYNEIAEREAEAAEAQAQQEAEAAAMQGDDPNEPLVNEQTDTPPEPAQMSRRIVELDDLVVMAQDIFERDPFIDVPVDEGL